MSQHKTTAERALEISTEAAAVGFDWKKPGDVLDKLEEELAEIRQALNEGTDRQHIEEEVGDLYFALVNFNRKMQIDSDSAFLSGVMKFERRYRALEKHVQNMGRQMQDLSADELEDVWKRVKMGENNGR
ncbi:MAG: hypothetical protein J6A01_03530 [Proteobacteria bacterium]|nr:hypothetical protein [Pseudomonadota bacterium]